MRRPLVRGTAVVAGMALLLLGPAAGAAEGDTIRISERPNGLGVNGASSNPAISSDGGLVAFHSSASNLVAGDTNLASDVFVRDVESGEVTRVSVASDGTEGNAGSRDPAISADGRFVAFTSPASNLVEADTNGVVDVFVHDTIANTTERVSVDSNGVQADGQSDQLPSISADGRYVVFRSLATNLVVGDTNATYDIFVHDIMEHTTERVSVDSNGVQADGESAGLPAISADGRYVAFPSGATNLVVGDTNGQYDIFLHDTISGTTERVSVDSNGTEANSGSFLPAISADGRYVAFPSEATNLVVGDTNGAWDIFVRDTISGTTERVSVDSNGAQADGESVGIPAFSADGRYVAFPSRASNLVADDSNDFADVFVHDAATSRITRVSLDSSGGQADGDSFLPAISADGRFVAFRSSATNLVPGDTNALLDIFRYQFLPDPPPPGGEDPFTDDDGSTFESDIEALARAGITKGCNPPDNTRFCPTDPVTRGQMAAFLVRALGYSDDGGGNLFSDDDGSTFESDIDRLGTAGVTKGCNPPDNTRFCPSDPVTRGQMAAFLVRALGYSDDGGGDLFTDDDGSIFEADIDRLGTAGVTKGCNPPDNTRFCPSDPVTRGQMAAFLTRALDLK